MVRKWFVGKNGVMLERVLNGTVRIEDSGYRRTSYTSDLRRKMKAPAIVTHPLNYVMILSVKG